MSGLKGMHAQDLIKNLRGIERHIVSAALSHQSAIDEMTSTVACETGLLLTDLRTSSCSSETSAASQGRWRLSVQGLHLAEFCPQG